MPGSKDVDNGPPVRLAFREICRSETPKRFPVPLGHSLVGVELRDLNRKVLGVHHEPKKESTRRPSGTSKGKYSAFVRIRNRKKKILRRLQEQQRNGLGFQEEQRNGRVLQEQQRKP